MDNEEWKRQVINDIVSKIENLPYNSGTPKNEILWYHIHRKELIEILESSIPVIGDL